jgi:Thiamine pyrophosphokinase C terminal
VSGWALMVLVLAACATVGIALTVLPAGQIFYRYLGTEWDFLRYWLTGLF